MEPWGIVYSVEFFGKNHYGKDGDPVLVWQAATRTMNGSIPQSLIDEAMQADSAAAASEYLAEWRSDVSGFVAREIVESATDFGVFERPYQSGLRHFAFVDPSGGSADSFTACVARRDADSLFVCALREARPPFSPESVVSEFAALLKSYHISRVTGDKYAGEWPREQFRKYGIAYDLAPKPKSDIYRDLLPMLNSGRVRLLDHPRLLSQLVNLERRTSRAGKDSIDHPPGQKDDVANAVAGAVVLAQSAARRRIQSWAAGGSVARQFDSAGETVTLVEATTGRVLYDRALDGVSPLSPLKNGCHPGPGINTEPWFDAAAAYFNSVNNIQRPRS